MSRGEPRTADTPAPHDREPGEAAGGAPGETPGEAGRGLLTVRLGSARFGLWVDEVLEIVRTPPVSRLPLTHPHVVGVTSVRGDVIPVLDLGLRLLDAPAERPGRLVLIRHEATGSMVGLLVDGVETLLPVAEDDVQEPPPAAEARFPADYVTGVVAADDDVVTILHLGHASAPPEPSRDGS